MTRFQELERAAEEVGLTVKTWSPGDGVTRYRFFNDALRHKQSYFGPGNGVYTALGYSDASTFVTGYVVGYAKAKA